VKCLYNSLTSKRLAVLGFAYKKDTGDTRETSAITVVNNLINEGASVRVYDPLVEADRIWEEVLENSERGEAVKQRLSVWPSAYEDCAEADAVIILTEWDEFSNRTVVSGDGRDRGSDKTSRVLDWNRVAQLMQKPMYVFDGRNVLDAQPLEKLGFRVESIGKGVM
jgi:UDPglucose 6-dehydrogenase